MSTVTRDYLEKYRVSDDETVRPQQIHMMNDGEPDSPEMKPLLDNNGMHM